MSQSHFKKFGAKKNSAIKEEFKQAKRKAKKEKAAAINQRFEEKRQMKQAIRDAQFQNTGVQSREASQPSSKKQFTSTKPVPGFKERPDSKPVTGNNKQLSTSRPSFKGKVFNNTKATTVAKDKTGTKQPITSTGKPTTGSKQPAGNEMPLNKYLAHCGVCSRRDAVALIKEGKVKVNNNIVIEPAFKVNEKDDVFFNGKKLFISKDLVYILLNKPKDYITTTDDPQGRKTVLQLTKMATTERIYPVGRLDRNTSGVLLLTNDGELTQMLSHPSYNITKVYEVKLDKPLTKADFDKILGGIKLEDGEIKADSLAYADVKDKSVIGIEIHSGRNRIVRRIFESLGYDVKGLDRVMYATLTKKNVDRGKWRFLSEKEVRLLKYMNKSKKPGNANG